MEIQQAVADVVRRSSRRLLAFLAARSHDIASSEDALAEAVCAALSAWPLCGIPDKPEAWLLTAARRVLIDQARHQNVHAAAAQTLRIVADEAVDAASGEAEFPDERIKLMFVCAHPAIDAAIRAPLMLQVVLGLDAALIASAYLVKPSAMGQRLSRAKSKILTAGIAYEVPTRSALPQRLAYVLESIYAAFGSASDHVLPEGNIVFEAIELAALMHTFMPDEPEVAGLYALCLYSQARRAARRSSDGLYVPLEQQDVTQWDSELIARADAALLQAAKQGRLGRFQIEAAIQHTHVHARLRGAMDWAALLGLYLGLLKLAPTHGATLAYAATLGSAVGPAAALEFLQTLPQHELELHQPYWALRADLLVRQGMRRDALSAYAMAIGLCTDGSIKRFLLARLQLAERSLRV